MKVPRDCSRPEPARALRRLGYELVRQRGSHMVLTTQQGGEPHVNIPAHRLLKVGMLHALGIQPSGRQDGLTCARAQKGRADSARLLFGSSQLSEMENL